MPLQTGIPTVLCGMIHTQTKNEKSQNFFKPPKICLSILLHMTRKHFGLILKIDSNAVMRHRMEVLKKENRIGTMRYYGDCLASIEKFCDKEVPYTTITEEWLRKFESSD